MHDLIPITALGGRAPDVTTIGRMTCTEVPEVALASVTARAGKTEAAKAALQKAIGVSAPQVECWGGEICAALWIGPDQWMLEAPFDSHEELAAEIKDLCGDNASVVEQTDAWTRFDVTGRDVLAVLELLCNLDCRKMENHHVKRCSIHHLSSIVRRLGEEHFALYGPRASAGSLHHAITSAMASVA